MTQIIKYNLGKPKQGTRGLRDKENVTHWISDFEMPPFSGFPFVFM